MDDNDFWEEQLRNWVEQSSNKNSARALPPKTMSGALTNRSKAKRMSLLPYPQRGADGDIDMTDWVAPQVAIDLIESAQLPGQVYRGEKAGTPEEARKMAVDVNFGSALLGRGAAPAGALGMNVWHGGPNKWAPEPDFPQGRPRLDKMGTGEGNQAYGHGFYSAQAKDVGQGYGDSLAHKAPLEGIDLLKYKGVDDPEYTANNWISYANGASESDIKSMLETMDPGTIGYDVLSGVIKKGESTLYKLDLPDEDVAKYLDWDAPLSEQGHLDLSGLPGNVAPLDAQEASQVTGERLYKRLANALGDRLPSDEAASKAFRKAGIPGLKYFDGMSRNKPLKEIKRDFLDALPEDADMEDVSVLFGKGHFKPDQEAVLKALEADDWLGFDYPSQAISAAFSPSASNWDMSPALVKAIAKAKEDGTRNYVTWDQDVLDRTKMLERNGDELGMGGGPLSAAAALQKQYEDEQLLKFLETGA